MRQLQLSSLSLSSGTLPEYSSCTSFLNFEHIMGNLRIHLAAASILALVCVNLVIAIEMKCKGMDIQVTEEQIMNVKECLSSAGVTDVRSLTPETAGCFARCVMEKKELVDKDNKPHKENINKMIDAAMPDAIKVEWKAAMEKCLDNEGSQLKSSADDPKCMSYIPLSMCSHMAFVKICQPEGA